jgi:hypothetical protein
MCHCLCVMQLPVCHSQPTAKPLNPVLKIWSADPYFGGLNHLYVYDKGYIHNSKKHSKKIKVKIRFLNFICVYFYRLSTKRYLRNKHN